MFYFSMYEEKKYNLYDTEYSLHKEKHSVNSNKQDYALGKKSTENMVMLWRL